MVTFLVNDKYLIYKKTGWELQLIYHLTNFSPHKGFSVSKMLYNI